MLKQHRTMILIVALFITLIGIPAGASEPSASAPPSDTPNISISNEMGEAMVREASRVKDEFRKHAESLFVRDPMGWGWPTISYLYGQLISVPMKLPDITRRIMDQSRVLGLLGSMFVIILLAAVFYSLIGQKRVLRRVETEVKPLCEKLPETAYPYFMSVLKVVVEALIPLILLGLFSLIDDLTDYQTPWLQAMGRGLALWTIGALINGLLRESLTRNLFPAASAYGKDIYRLTRLVLIYALLGIACFWGMDAFDIRQDVISLARFAVTLSIITVLYLLFRKKDAFLSLLPKLDYRSYLGFIRLLDKYYKALIGFSFAVALLWCLGYNRLGQVVLFKIWASAAAFIAIMLLYSVMQNWVEKWSVRIDPTDEAAVLLIRSLKVLLLYVNLTATCVIVLNLLGLLDPLQRVMSFPVFNLGANQVSFWIILKAVFILLTFVYASRLLQAYLDYKVYPVLGIDAGLGYALNTFFKYTTIAVGILISLKIVGIDLRFLLVFAGAIGIGIGLGLQNMAANIISGFSIIFGGKIRKGDWIEAGSTLGIVTDIYLRATKVRTRDNIEYLVPNSDLISNTIVNYSLSSPMIRIEVPVGVSYDADPKEVEKILLKVAEKEPMVDAHEKPAVRFIEFGDNSINFELLVWIDVQNTARKKIRSRLNFAIFEALQNAEIEIPFPQRDIHIRTR
jgi:small-conductance mechanosensitive channel